MPLTNIKKNLGKIIYKVISLENFYILERLLPFEYDHYLSENINRVLPYCTIQRLKETSNDLLKQYMGFKDEVKKETVKEWLQDEHICFLALTNNRIIGSIWASTKYAPYSNIKKIRPIFEGTAYLFKLFVSPDFRGRGIGTLLALNVLRISDDMGFTKVMSIVYNWNETSIRLMEKLGFKRGYKLCFLKLGPLKQCFLRPY